MYTFEVVRPVEKVVVVAPVAVLSPAPTGAFEFVVALALVPGVRSAPGLLLVASSCREK